MLYVEVHPEAPKCNYIPIAQAYAALPDPCRGSGEQDCVFIWFICSCNTRFSPHCLQLTQTAFDNAVVERLDANSENLINALTKGYNVSLLLYILFLDPWCGVGCLSLGMQ